MLQGGTSRTLGLGICQETEQQKEGGEREGRCHSADRLMLPIACHLLSRAASQLVFSPFLLTAKDTEAKKVELHWSPGLWDSPAQLLPLPCADLSPAWTRVSGAIPLKGVPSWRACQLWL